MFPPGLHSLPDPQALATGFSFHSSQGNKSPWALHSYLHHRTAGGAPNPHQLAPRGPASRRVCAEELVTSFPWLSDFSPALSSGDLETRDSPEGPSSEDPVAALIIMVRLGLKARFYNEMYQQPYMFAVFLSISPLFSLSWALPSRMPANTALTDLWP